MHSATIEGLPSELLRSVCGYLDYTHPPSLLAFARTNKSCYSIATNLLFRTIKFSVANGGQLVQDVQRWDTILRRETGFLHVRRLIVSWTDDEEQRKASHYKALDPCERYEDAFGLQAPWDLYIRRPQLPMQDCFITNKDWKILAGLVESLAGLTDMFFSCPGHFPPDLLHLLHDNLPRCRLHHYNYPLKLDNPALGSRIASSPSLHSVGDSVARSLDRKVWDAVRHRAGRIKEAHLWWPKIAATEIDESQASSRWNELGTNSPAPLEVVHFSKTSILESPLSAIVLWQVAYGDFSTLRVLRIEPPTTDLSSLPRASQFPVLATLAFTCASETTPEYWERLLPFLHDVPCLTTLQLKRWDRSVSVVSGLGPGLRMLDFSTRAGWPGHQLLNDHIHQLAELCPELEHVKLELRRSRGDAAEVALYRALGRLPRLQHLAVELDASMPGLSSSVVFLDANGDSVSHGTAIEPWFDSQDAETLKRPLHPYRKGHVKDLFVNSAIDADLARSIFQVIDKAKAGILGPVLPLEKLNIHASNSNMFQMDRPLVGRSPQKLALRPYVSSLRRKWVVERDLRDYARTLIHVNEVDNFRSTCSSFAKHVGEVQDWTQVFGIWTRVWPFEEDSVEFFEFEKCLAAWKSFPLAL